LRYLKHLKKHCLIILRSFHTVLRVYARFTQYFAFTLVSHSTSRLRSFHTVLRVYARFTQYFAFTLVLHE
jgi:hypothetical protein